ncbi:MAG TPA: D-glycerate dehydrogenase, partial [Terriglobia bacterium]|nr:D-glycerate dehydrogenase [Terriglobia bacterium]
MLGNVLVTKPVFPEAMDFLKNQVAIDANLDDRVLPREELIARLKGKQGAVTLLTDVIDRDVLESLPDIRVISNIAVGFNNIDIENASRLGILVTNTPGVLTETTADFAWTLLMAAARRVVEGDTFARSGQWKAWGLQMLLGNDIFGKTLGIIGFGRIGQAMARRAMGFSMRIQYFDTQPVPPEAVPPGVKAASLDALLATSDFISVHVPLLPETSHLLNDTAFAQMKPNCVVVNTARGPVVDEKALARALKSGKIAGAGLDVFEREPEIEPALLELKNVVLAPHIASASRET